MAFLDNSGDIILDAVLTDTGRYRLAKGDGSFKITKFALGDDEIDYSLYDKNNPSGSAYYDLDILQTPILEAFTDNASALKSHLISINQTDLLFLPVLKLNEQGANTKSFNSQGYFVVAVDSRTEEEFVASDPGIFFTNNKQSTVNNSIVIDQGLDTPKLSPTQPLSAELVETIYMVEMDNRLGSLYGQTSPATATGPAEMNRSYIDDDQIATYLLSIQKNPNEIVQLPTAQANNPGVQTPIQGPRGTSLKLKLAATLELQTSTYLFEELGTESGSAPNDFRIIDTNIRVVGATTGYKLDIPVRYIKKI
jgi:hypothetical protein